MAVPGESPPFKGVIYQKSLLFDGAGWSMGFFLKAANAQQALTDLVAIKDKVRDCQTKDVATQAVVVSAFGVKGDSYAEAYNEGTTGWASTNVGTFGIGIDPEPDDTSLYPTLALLLREQSATGGYRNFLYLRGVDAKLMARNGTYDSSLSGWSTVRDALFTIIKTKCSMINRDREVAGNQAKVQDIASIVDERIVSRKCGRPFISLFHGRKTLR